MARDKQASFRKQARGHGKGMFSYRAGIMQHHIACLVSRDQPSPLVPSAELGGAVAQHAAGHHVFVEGELGFFGGKVGCERLGGEFLLDLSSEFVAWVVWV